MYIWVFSKFYAIWSSTFFGNRFVILKLLSSFVFVPVTTSWSTTCNRSFGFIRFPVFLNSLWSFLSKIPEDLGELQLYPMNWVAYRLGQMINNFLPVSSKLIFILQTFRLLVAFYQSWPISPTFTPYFLHNVFFLSS